MNTLGSSLRIHLFGESHGRGVGVVMDGLPPGLPIEEGRIQAALDSRRPGQGPLASPRNEADRLEILSGALDGHATGAPLALWIANTDARSKHYDRLRAVPRPGHADWTAFVRHRGHNDGRGGGHFSGRLTAPLVAAGAIAATLLEGSGVQVAAHLHGVGARAGPAGEVDVATMRLASAGQVKTAHDGLAESFVVDILAARKKRDSLGGVVEFRAEGLPVGIGEPFADSIESVLGHALFAIPAVKGVSFGAGFAAATMRGSENNDPWLPDGSGGLRPASNNAGGILGGLSTGAPIWGHVAIKPTSSIFLPQQSVDLRTGEPAILELAGRHDPIIAIRAVPVVAAVVSLGLADLLLRHAAQAALAASWPARPVAGPQDATPSTDQAQQEGEQQRG